MPRAAGSRHGRCGWFVRASPSLPAPVPAARVISQHRRPLPRNAQVSLVGTAEHTAKVPLHSLAASALAVLPSGVDVLSAGEDGKVWSLACTGPAVVPTLVGRADSVAIYDIKFADVTGFPAPPRPPSGARVLQRRGYACSGAAAKALRPGRTPQRLAHFWCARVRGAGESYITAGAGGGLKRWSRCPSLLVPLSARMHRGAPCPRQLWPAGSVGAGHGVSRR